MNTLVVASQTQTIEIGYAEPQITPKVAFERIWDRAWQAGTDSLLQEWAASRVAWLKKVTRKSGSAHTDRAYRRGLDQWWAFIQADPWLLDEERGCVEVWHPDMLFPVIETEELVWHPPGAAAPLVIPVPGLFAP